MACEYRNTAREEAMSDIKISIQGLTKVFGKEPSTALSYVNQGVSKQDLLQQYRHVLALHDINMQIQSHKIEVIMGLSGSGKSTLVRHINRLLEPTAGSISVDGEDILTMSEARLRNFRQSKIAMVFQNFALLPHCSVLDNIAFGLSIQNKGEKFIRDQSHYWLEKVGLEGFESHYPEQLSGGMQQRVGLARALACDTDILMMDEAFSALDPLIRSDMQDLLLRLQSELNKTIVFITHDLDEALKLGDKISILKDGRMIQQDLASNILLHPQDDYVKRFVADVNWSRGLRAKSIMQDGKPENQVQVLKVKENESIDKVINSLLCKNSSSIVVEDENGGVVGYIDTKVLAQTLF